MSKTTAKNELLSRLDSLSPEDQERVLGHIRELGARRRAGVPGRSLPRFAGVLAPGEAVEIDQAVIRACEQVDASEW